MKLTHNTHKFVVGKDAFESTLNEILSDINLGIESSDKDIENVIGYAIEKMRPKTKKSQGSGVAWVLQAVSKDETRAFLHYAIYDEENNQTVATDGCRLHVLEGYHFPHEGFYAYNGKELLKKDAFEDKVGRFPNYMQVLPYKDNTARVTLENEKTLSTGKLGTTAFDVVGGEESYQYHLSTRFYSEALNGAQDPVMYSADGMSPLLVESTEDGKLRRAVVMPRRIK